MAESLVKVAGMSLFMGEQQLKDVSPAIFARKPRGEGGKIVNANHPAFVYGHLSLYAKAVAEKVGLDGSRLAAPAGFDALFDQGKECQDDPAGTIYPPMKTITEAFFNNYRGLLEILPKVPDAKLLEPNPTAKRFPLIGEFAMFLLTSHIMMHLGQVSTWRRCMGLGSAM
jgi:hypothetical protein